METPAERRGRQRMREKETTTIFFGELSRAGLMRFMLCTVVHDFV